MGQIKTYLSTKDMAAFDKRATELGVSRYELAQQLILQGLYSLEVVVEPVEPVEPAEIVETIKPVEQPEIVVEPEELTTMEKLLEGFRHERE